MNTTCAHSQLDVYAKALKEHGIPYHVKSNFYESKYVSIHVWPPGGWDARHWGARPCWRQPFV